MENRRSWLFPQFSSLGFRGRFLGPISKRFFSDFSDRELFIFFNLCFLILVLGFFPNLFFDLVLFRLFFF